jgi:hypothetical protein
MEVYRAGTAEIRAGDRAGVFLKLKPDIDVKRGGLLYSTKSKPTVGLPGQRTVGRAEPSPGPGR